MSSSRTLASLRHLCSLGLPGELLVPQFMDALDEAVPADVHTFVWHDREMQPVRLFTDSAVVNTRMADLAAFLATLRVDKETWHAVKAAAFSGAPHPLLAKVYGFLGNEIRRPLGMPIEEVRFLPEVAGQHGSLNLWRSGRGGYSGDELAFLTRACAYLGYALSAAPPSQPGPMIDEEGVGVVLLDPAGAVLHTDETAGRLLPLAIDAPFGRDFRHDDGLAAVWRSLCRRLTLLTEGCATPPPLEVQTNAWGRFVFRASWLQRPAAGGPGTIAVTVRLRVPRKIKLWWAIHLLGLSPRQQEVTLLFAEGMSQNDIAARLGIARTTVIDHIRRLYDRLAIPPDREALRAHLLAQIPDNWTK